MTKTPWPIIMALVALLAWLGNCSIKIVLGSLLTPFLIGLFNIWDDTMKIISMIFAGKLEIYVRLAIRAAPQTGSDTSLPMAGNLFHFP
jgi:ABC-type proline/glycine betaine transport system permease subunit